MQSVNRAMFGGSLFLLMVSPAYAWEFSTDTDAMTDEKVGVIMGVGEDPRLGLFLKCWAKGTVDPILVIVDSKILHDDGSQSAPVKIRFDDASPIDLEMESFDFNGRQGYRLGLNKDEIGQTVISQFEASKHKIAVEVNDMIIKFDASSLQNQMAKLKPICEGAAP